MDSRTPEGPTGPYQPPSGAWLPSGADPPSVAGYEVRRELGRGGMGIVYEALHVPLKRVVALKTIRGPEQMTRDGLRRFRTEAEAVARLQHSNIVQIFDVGECQGVPYLALEFCPGGSLSKRLGGGPVPPREAAELVETLARAVQAAHAAGVVHRDLKPANILLAADGSPKIADFGLAKTHDGPTDVTQEGTVLGTPCYMAPEQASGSTGDIGPHTDIHALGAILYELLTGRLPFKAATRRDTLLQVISAEPIPPSRVVPDLPAELERVCLRCLAKRPSDRYAQAELLAADLASWRQGHIGHPAPGGPRPRPALDARRLALAGAGVATVLVLGVIAAHYATRDRPGDTAPATPLAQGKREPTTVAARTQGAAQQLGARDLVHSGWSEPLFDGRSLRGWQPVQGVWTVAEDGEGSSVLAGTSGLLRRKLPLLTVEPPRRLEYYRLTLTVQLRAATSVEVHFGGQQAPAGAGVGLVVRVGADRVSLRRKEPTTGRQEAVAGAEELRINSARPQPIQIERQRQAWWVSLGAMQGELVGGMPHGQDKEGQEFALAVEGGPAWFSDVRVEELIGPQQNGN